MSVHDKHGISVQSSRASFSLHRKPGFVSKSVVATVVVLAGLATSASASVINYGDFSSAESGLIYTNVRESSITDDIALYGVPELNNNTLDFDPENFGHFSIMAEGGPLGFTDGQLNFEVQTVAADGGITSLVIEESGDYSFFGSGGTVDTNVSVDFLARVTILEVDGVAIDPVELILEPTMAFADDIVSTGSPSGLLSWELSALIDEDTFRQALQAEVPGFTDFENGITKLEVVVDNQLAANSEDDTIAYVIKKDFKVIPGGNLPVPEPATALLMLAGLLIRRR